MDNICLERNRRLYYHVCTVCCVGGHHLCLEFSQKLNYIVSLHIKCLSLTSLKFHLLKQSGLYRSSSRLSNGEFGIGIILNIMQLGQS